jgi:hypothetical protein
MNARKPEPRPRLTYTHWPAARPPGRPVPPLPRPYEWPDVPRPEEDRSNSALDEPGYGHGV